MDNLRVTTRLSAIGSFESMIQILKDQSIFLETEVVAVLSAITMAAKSSSEGRDELLGVLRLKREELRVIDNEIYDAISVLKEEQDKVIEGVM